MRKILFILFAALALVACEKEENISYEKCEVMPEILTIPAEGGTFTVRTNVPSYIFSGAYKSSEHPTTDFGFGLRSFFPSSYPYVYDSKKNPLFNFEDLAMLKDVYYIEQVDATTFKFTIKPPVGYDRIDLGFIPEGGIEYANKLYIIIR